MEGGELFDRLVGKTPPHYSEISAQSTVRMLLKAIAYLHYRGISHRDIRPENILLQSQIDDHVCKLADFGYAAKVPPGGHLTEVTPLTHQP